MCWLALVLVEVVDAEVEIKLDAEVHKWNFIMGERSREVKMTVFGSEAENVILWFTAHRHS